MPDPATIALFALSSLAVLALPGPTMVFVLARTLEHGRAAGLVSVAGVQAGALVHVAAAAAGLSALLTSCEEAMMAVRLVGAAYLVHLGLRGLRGTAGGAHAATGRRPGWRGLFWEGLLVDALNPKTAIFFLAFLPHFVDPAHGAVSLQVVLLGACFVVLALGCDVACSLAASALGGRLAGRPRVERRLARVAGGTMLSLGALAAIGGLAA